MVIMSMAEHEEKMVMLDVEAKLAQSSEKFRSDKVIDARQSLQKLREKHGV